MGFKYDVTVKLNSKKFSAWLDLQFLISQFELIVIKVGNFLMRGLEYYLKSVCIV